MIPGKATNSIADSVGEEIEMSQARRAQGVEYVRTVLRTDFNGLGNLPDERPTKATDLS